MKVTASRSLLCSRDSPNQHPDGQDSRATGSSSLSSRLLELQSAFLEPQTQAMGRANVVVGTSGGCGRFCAREVSAEYSSGGGWSSGGSFAGDSGGGSVGDGDGCGAGQVSTPGTSRRRLRRAAKRLRRESGYMSETPGSPHSRGRGGTRVGAIMSWAGSQRCAVGDRQRDGSRRWHRQACTEPANQ